MSHRRWTLALAGSLVLVAGVAAAAEPLLAPADDGRTFVYRARPGDTPGGVAEMFGIPPAGVPAFLAENGIRDATRVGAGFQYRVPNVAARALAEGTGSLAKENARLTATARESETKLRALAREAEQLRDAATVADARAARAARVIALWPVAELALVVLAVIGAGAVVFARAALHRQQQADRYARTLARELDDKRKAALADRQESSRRIIELENRVRALETQLDPRVVVSGRGNAG